MRLSIAGQAISEERLPGLFSRHAGQEASTLTPALEARILEWTLNGRPSDGATQWSTRRPGNAAQISHMRVSRVLGQARPQSAAARPLHGDQRPDFEQKAADINWAVSATLRPHAAVFCVDEKTAIQALDRRIRCCHSRRDAPSGTALSTFGTARCLCTRRSTPRPARLLARRPCDTRLRSSSRPGGHRCSPAPRGKEIHVIADKPLAP